MKKQTIFAVTMAAVMSLSMAACGETQTDNEGTPTTAPTAAEQPTEAPQPTTAPAASNVTIENASITFEDGNYGFVDAYMNHARSANLDISLADFNGSKAVKVVNTTGTSKTIFVGIDVSSLFGADVTKIAGVEMVVGTSHEDGKFHATSGNIYSWWGTERESATLNGWSVYMERKNPTVIKGTIPAGCEFVADAQNIIYVSIETDNGATDASVPATLYIDDIRFYDAAGNTLKPADTTVAFNWPESDGVDVSNQYALSNTTAFDGYVTSGSGWGQNGADFSQELLDALVPGTALEVSFASEDNTMWLVFPDAAAGWTRVAQGEAYINNSGTTAQITYEQIVAAVGEDKANWGARLQFEAQTNWEVYGVTVGTASQRVGISNAVEFEGFVTSGDGWAQNGFEMPQEIIDALVPGSVLEIDYASEDDTLWIVMPWAEAGWMRCGQGTAVCDGSKCYVTYEQIAEMCGEDKSTWGAMMQCEAQTKWEVYGLRVGTAVNYPVISGLTAFDGFTTSGDGWGQNGAEMPQELMDALVPGSIIEISFASEDNTMWIVMPDAAAGWSRCAQNKAVIDNGKAYITYEQIAEICGEDKSTWGARMQFEAQTAWEVYGIRVGKYAAAGATAAPVEKEETPAVAAPVVTAADGKGTVVAADASWWTQIALSKEELFAGVAQENITGFKFTGDTDFIIAYNESDGVWKQLDAASSFELPVTGIDLTDDVYYFCFVLSKGDSVVYNLAWEVLTGGAVSTDTPVVVAPAEDLVINFASLTAGGYGYNAAVNGDAVDVTIDSQYQEIQYILPEAIDLAAYKTLIVDVTSNAALDIKLVDSNAELNQYNQKAPFHDNYTADGQAITEPIYIDLGDFAEFDLAQINFMAMGNDTAFTIKSITFVK